ncbi:MAG TPA: NUDIX hydrolase [Spirochaetota bacterium]|nr:NUDIX hydrolase [Spirochaetota bacterium]HOK91627.1 NUDIX hydrolase [Spirochaetota bacterium]HPD78063.1 NUDIX hydrolase [Spirochaetota bacterium]HPP94737.1 NUDIX hydrolase [Spirochaetota bacterium]HRU64619.1 NUDIX hydrolase [Spirochaetota bacterium]
MSSESGKVRIRVAGILIRGNRLLLIAHKKNNEVYWLLPGGGVDYGESLHEALRREFEEELNVAIDVKDLVLVSDSIDPSGKRHVVNICFLCNYLGGDFVLGDDKRLHDFKFFSTEELSDITIFPPINNELVDIIKGKIHGRYIGKLWR